MDFHSSQVLEWREEEGGKRIISNFRFSAKFFVREKIHYIVNTVPYLCVTGVMFLPSSQFLLPQLWEAI